MSVASYSLAELAAHIGGELKGEHDIQISTVSTLVDAKAGQISFLANRVYKKDLPHTQASAVILSASDAPQCPTCAIIVSNPYLGYAKIAHLLYADKQSVIPTIDASAAIDSSASVDGLACISAHCVIEAGARIEAGVYLGSGVSIGRNVTVGRRTKIHANVSIYSDTVIGSDSVIHSGAVLGCNGFGMVQDTEKKQWLNVPQIGRVVIGNRVDVGANTTIDRGAIGDTVIEDDVKLDNQVQVAHNVRIGEGTAIAGCVGISGSTKIGKHCLIGGGVGFVGHLEITDNVVVTGMSLVSKSIKKSGMYSSGVPARAHAVWQKNMARLGNLDKIVKKFNKSKLEE